LFNLQSWDHPLALDRFNFAGSTAMVGCGNAVGLQFSTDGTQLTAPNNPAAAGASYHGSCSASGNVNGGK
jgi:hypothetical protein